MITPIIMEDNIEVVREKVELLRKNKESKVHFDIGDGLFSDMLSVTPADLRDIDLRGVMMDIHLLVDDPMEWVEECIQLKPTRIIGQIERMGTQKVFVETVDKYGVEAGLALMVTTPIEAIETDLLKQVKTILLLAVPAGTSGSAFDKQVLGKIGDLRRQYPGKIIVDGGINPTTYQLTKAAGASEAGANSAYWRGEFE